MPSILGSATPTIGLVSAVYGYGSPYADIDDGTYDYDLTVSVTAGSVVLLIASVPSGSGSNSDVAAQFQFTRGASAIGPEFTTFFTDNWTTNEEAGQSHIAYLDEHGTSGSVTYTVQANETNTSAVADYKRAGGIMAIEILADEFVALNDTGDIITDDAFSTTGFAVVTSMTQTFTPASADNVILCVYSGQIEQGGPTGDTSVDHRFSVDGTEDGVYVKGGQDDPTECGISCMMWAFTGHSTSKTFAVEADQVAGNATQTGTDRRRFQAIELKSPTAILGTVQSTTASTASTATFAGIDGLTVTAESPTANGVALVVGASQASLASGADDGAEIRLTAGGSAIGPDGMVTAWNDSTDEFYNGQISWAEASVAASRTWTTQWKTALSNGACVNDGTAPQTMQVIDFQPQAAGGGERSPHPFSGPLQRMFGGPF